MTNKGGVVAEELEEPSFTNLGTVVTISVGVDGRPFVIHKDLLYYHSAYFRNLFKGSFIEAKSSVMQVEDTTVETFGHFVEWLYTTVARRPLPACHRVATSFVDPANPDPPSLDELLDVYIFADRYNICLLRNDVMKSWQYRNYNWGTICNELCEDMIKKAFDKLPHSSTLCRYIVQNYATMNFWIFPPMERELWAKLPHEFLSELIMIASTVLQPRSKPIDTKSCDFHEHKNEVEKKECIESLWWSE
ncbi:hypothetical protein H2199_004992 [Coniosporium tulheliwenetii]|uniref:Uncharacterized protein n=1 Tax=Coniosporium tulheliwenetii TaxID=3383036 RepID=A0ACC2Z245_9PEZI|nr:hypothetical protein H2199_004992 [Cladosporium sp. JES 115]